MFDFSENSLSFAKMPKMQNGSYKKIQLTGEEQQSSPTFRAAHPDMPVPLMEPLCAGITVTPRCDIFAQGCACTQPAPEHAHWLLPFPKLLWHISVDWSRKIWGSQGVIYLCMNACRCNLRSSPKQNIFTALAKAILHKSNLFGG